MAAAQATKKLFKDIGESIMVVLGATEISEEVGKAILGDETPASFPCNADAFAEAAVSSSADEALTLQRALAYKMDSPDPIIDCEPFLEKTQKALPDLVGMQVQRGLGKAGGIGCKQCQLSAFCPHLRDMAKKITHATFLKEVFKAYKGAPVKKAPPPPPSTGATKKFFGKKKTEEETASPASPGAGENTGDSSATTVVSSTKKTFGTKKTTDTPAAATATTEESSNNDGTTVVATKKFFGKKKSAASTPASEIENQSTAAAPRVATPPPQQQQQESTTGGDDDSSQTVVSSTKKTFGKKKTVGSSNDAQPTSESSSTFEASPSSVSAPPAENAEKKDTDNATETVVATKKTFFGKKKQTPTTSELPSEAASRSVSNMNLGDSQSFEASPSSATYKSPPSAFQQSTTTTEQQQSPSAGGARRTFGVNRTSSPPAASMTSRTSPPQPSNTTGTNVFSNTLSPRPVVVSETSTTGAVITPRCPECAARYLIKHQDASCQTDWGARFMTAQQADESSQEGKIRGLLRNDITSALEEAQNKANQLLDMKRQFVEARMRSISEQESAILQGLPASDRERLTVLQNSIAPATTPNTHPTVDYLRAARSTLNSGHSPSSPNDEEEVARLREGARHRLRALAEEEAHIKAQLELMESNRHHELEAASKGRALLMTDQVNSSINNSALSQWNSASPNRSHSSMTNGSPGKRTKRW